MGMTPFQRRFVRKHYFRDKCLSRCQGVKLAIRSKRRQESLNTVIGGEASLKNISVLLFVFHVNTDKSGAPLKRAGRAWYRPWQAAALNSRYKSDHKQYWLLPTAQKPWNQRNGCRSCSETRIRKYRLLNIQCRCCGNFLNSDYKKMAN